MNQLNLQGSIHDHADGCISMRPMMVRKYGETRTNEIIAKVKTDLKSVRNKLASIPNLFSMIYDLLQDRESIQEAGYRYGKLRAEQGYKKAEGIFAPQYHVNRGLTLRQATRAMYDGMRQAEKEFGIRITPTIGIGRETSSYIGEKVASIACEYEGEMILDLVCDEIDNPPQKFHTAYKRTFGTKTKRVCHVEVVSPSPVHTYNFRLIENLKTALFDLKCDGLQHGSGLIHDQKLIDYVVDNQIRVAGCPLSNLALGHIQDVKEIGIDKLLDAGVWYTLGPDDDLFLASLEEVAIACDKVYHFNAQQKQQLEANALRPL